MPDPRLTIPPALAKEFQSAAEVEQRPADELVREALERYLVERRLRSSVSGVFPRTGRRTPAEAAARLREQRAGTVLPEGVTIKDLMTHGRA